MRAKKQLTKDEQGLVSILVTLIIMLILSLIVTGFAQLARQEQREALDRQLATQALYAAESAVNDATRTLALDPAFEKTTCAPAMANENYLEPSGNIQYSCLLVEHDLTYNEYQNVQPEKSIIVPIEASQDLTAVTVNWQGANNVTSLSSAAYPSLPSAVTWGTNIGIMRVDLVAASVLSFDSFAANNFTVFGYPRLAAAGTTTYTTAKSQSGQFAQADCSAAPNKVKRCKLTIDIPAGSTGRRFYLRLKPIYTEADIAVCFNDCDGKVTNSLAQVQIDATGKANDVLKRIQVLKDRATDTSNLTEKQDYTLESGDMVCKLISTTPSSTTRGTCP